MRKLLTLILLLICASGQAASLLSVQAATQTYSVIATTTADSVPTPRYAIRGVTDTYYTPLEASPASAGPRISIGGVTYGLASRTPAIGGNISLVRDASGTWVCHTFLSSGDFEVVDPAGIATCEYLIVGGGGGGSGGGGGGGYVNIGTTTLSVGIQAVVVGGGGTAGVPAVGGTGYQSSIGSTIAAGGAGGLMGVTYDGGAGGSGGGGYGNSETKGGNGGTDGANGAASGAGTAGGLGQGSTTTWLSRAYGGGGGGGTGSPTPASQGIGGNGGGGNGGYGTFTTGVDGFPGGNNTGGGGGGGATVGAGNRRPAGGGGSGIVKIRYLIEE